MRHLKIEPIRDPEGNEPRHLLEISRLRNAQVIEIGCGDGRLTHRYGHHAGWIAGTDPDGERLAIALENRPAQLTSNLSFVQANAESLPFPAQRFQVALLAWSL